MSFWRKTSSLVGCSVVLLVNVISLSYVVTLDRLGYGGTELGAFSGSNSIQNSFYIGQRAGRNVYTAGIPFESQTTRYLVVEGCPCYDATKIEVLADMVTTREFVLNVLFWAIPVSLGAFLLRRRWMLLTQDKKNP